MKNSPEISVIVPVYNTEKYLRQCLDSIRNQTFDDIEIICVDDGSTDDSLYILNEYSEMDDRIIVLTQERSNAGAARNKGLAIARGKYLAFLDSDDFFNSNMLEKCHDVMEGEDSDIVIFGASQFDMRTGKTSPMPWALRVENCPAERPFSALEMKDQIFNSFQNWPWNKMYRHSFIEKYDITFQEILRTNDMAFVCTALALAKRISIIDERLVTYRTGSGTSLQSTNSKAPLSFWDAYVCTKERLINHNIYEPFEQSFLNTAMGGILYNLNSVNTAEGKEKIYELIQNRAEKDFDFFAHGPEYYYDSEQYDELLRIAKNEFPKVSVIMPSLNVAPHIQKCLQSVIAQTLDDIEIICVDAGSTDGTLETIREYADSDNRIKIILSDQKSYGYQMNMGLIAATGEYIGIVETDDFIDPDMYEKLYNTAKAQNAELVKANYYRYQTAPEERSTFFELYSKLAYNRLLKQDEIISLTSYAPSIWTGLYDRRFLIENGIDFLETPGASFQDTAFILKVLISAQKVVLLHDAYLHYRVDNDNSSVKSTSKVFCVCDEMGSVDAFLSERPDKRKIFNDAIWARKAEVYRWNYFRLADEFRYIFVFRIHDEFIKGEKEHSLNKAFFTTYNWNMIHEIMKDPEQFYLENRGQDIKDEPDSMAEIPEDVCSEFSTWLTLIEKPLVSVIIPVYNTSPYLVPCLNSICGQSLKEIEIICVNDGSTDDSAEVLDFYARRDARIQVFTQENKGQSAARNLGISVARGDYLYFMDSDDLLSWNALEYLYHECIEQDLDVIYFDGDAVFDSPELEDEFDNLKTYYKRDINFTNVYTGYEMFAGFRQTRTYRVSPCLQLIKREHMLNHGILFPEGFIYEDNVFTMQCMLDAQRTSHRTNVLFYRRVRKNSTITVEASAKHIYGYYNCFLYMQSYLLKKDLPHIDDDGIEAELRMTINNAADFFWQASKEERQKFISMVHNSTYFLNTFFLPYVNSRFGVNGKQMITYDNTTQKLNDIYGSWSYRIGRAITFIPRKMRGGIQCISDHGLSYTVKYFLKKLGLN